MSLSRLELVGFKSFMDPVKLEFRKGITCILGPNGCGKTNIVDAVRWVLGEQSARQLRSTKMENVIFNGTERHKPTGYALVNMTMNNERGVFPIDYSEITITRKVYRSGISEYFINKTPCRLKDIRELFADTGTGSHSYAVIEQEMVDFVLNDAHGERRQMFEEASGIVKYRMRREEARRKLKLTESDLVRLDDILEELGKNVRSLRYQVGKTRRYRNLSEKVRKYGLVLLRKSLSSLLDDKRKAEKELGDARELTRRDDDSLEEKEKAVEKAKLALVEIEKEHTSVQNGRYEVRRRIQVSEEKVIQLSERKGEAERRIERARREIEEARERLEKISERMSNVGDGIEESVSMIGSEEEGVRELAGRFEEITARMERLQTELIDLKQTQLDFLQDQARARSAAEHYEKVLAELDGRAAELRERVTSLEAETARLAKEKERAESSLAETRRAAAAIDGERETRSIRLSEIGKILDQREGVLSSYKADLASLTSRHELYLRMKEDFEGFPRGARHVLKKKDPRVRGPLAEMLHTEDKYRKAVEAVLGGMLDGVVVKDLDGALELVGELAGGKRGGARFFAEDPDWKETDGSGVEFDGMIGALREFVDVPDESMRAVEQLLEGIYLFDAPEKALEFTRSAEGASAGAVTMSGIYFRRGRGVFFAGEPEEVSLLARSGEIEKLSKKIEQLRGKLELVEAECAKLRDEKRGHEARLEELSGAASSKMGEMTSKREELQEAERVYIADKEKCALLSRSLEELEASRSETLTRLEEARLSMAMTEGGGDSPGAGVKEEELARVREEREKLESALTEKKIGLASMRGSIEKQREELRGLSEMEKQFRSIVEQRSLEIESSREEVERLARTIEEERGNVKDLLDEENSYQERLGETGGLLEERRVAITAMEKELKERKSERDRIFEKINDVRIRLSSIDTRMRDMVDRGREVYAEDLECYLEGMEKPLDEEESSVTEEMLEKEKARLESLGPVNLAAVEEYEEKKQRLEFLESQKEDLIKAEEELEEAIRKINRRARKLFLETFGVVRGYFGDIFRTLFEGGEADLQLGEGTDPLEADIIIKARPKGKRFQDISLLSGGERALTALALLFALYKAKPSPFCIFDEVDAPLDDSNIQRFVRMLGRFAEETQFIIITHNKRTMEAADRLFGVTMEEKGVSRVVSVDLTEIEDVLRSRAPSGGEKAAATVSSN